MSSSDTTAGMGLELRSVDPERAGVVQRKIRVLIVEDDPDLAAALLERLRRRGFFAEAVSDGEEALGRLARLAYDVMLVDQVLPGADGLQVIRRARSRQPALGAVVLMEHGAERWRIPGAGSGVELILEKTTDMVRLCGAIRAAAQHAWESEAIDDGSGT